MHKHIWQTILTKDSYFHKDGNKYLTYVGVQYCDCGVYRTKEFIHEEDLKARGGAQ